MTDYIRRTLLTAASFAVLAPSAGYTIITCMGEVTHVKPAAGFATSEPRDVVARTVVAAPQRREPMDRPRAGVSVKLAADARGHFVTRAQLNRVSADVMVDTGASVVALSAEVARRIGVDPRPSDFSSVVSTANGKVKAARVMLDEVRIGDVVVERVEGLVLPPGALDGVLLGMSFLKRLSKVEMESGRLVLVR